MKTGTLELSQATAELETGFNKSESAKAKTATFELIIIVKDLAYKRYGDGSMFSLLLAKVANM